jgi:hypothetical protein
MKIYDILVERKIQRTQIMYHGTSSALLPNILKHGLLANPPKVTYSRETDVGDVGYDSFGGVYLTKDKYHAEDGAMHATQAHGGNPIVVTVQYVLGSVTSDEDFIVEVLINVLSGRAANTVEKFQIDLVKYYSDKQNFHDEVERVIHHFDQMAKYNNIKITRPALSDLRTLAAIVLNFIKEKYDGTTRPDTYIDFNLLNDIRHLPEFDSAMRKVLISIKPINTRTIRITRNIGFKGKTRILKIEDVYGGEDDDQYYPPEIHYPRNGRA